MPPVLLYLTGEHLEEVGGEKNEGRDLRGMYGTSGSFYSLGDSPAALARFFV